MAKGNRKIGGKRNGDDPLTRKLGSTFVKRLIGETILSIGDETFSRDRLVIDAKCGNFAAARRLMTALGKVRVRTVAELKTLNPRDLARQPGVGETTIYVLLCVQDALGLKSADWPNTWRTYAGNERERE